MKIVLFDIDGTLISSGGTGARAMQHALVEHFGTSGPREYHYGGKTDRQIARDLMRLSGFTDDVIDARMDVLIETYLANLHGEFARTPGAVKVHPGVMALLDALDARDDVTVGLLTGNVEPGARVKMEVSAIGMHRFRLGAYGSDDERRDALPSIARTRATALLAREISGEALVIIGDTPFDITCGRGECARAVAVATGSYSRAALAEHEPAALFDDFRDTARVIEAIVGA